jgi:hypothetical protein
MRQSDAPPQPDEPGLAEWLLFWLQLAILALLALFGAFVAADNAPGDYACGLALALMALGLAALRIKSRFDGEKSGWAGFLLVDDWQSLVAVTVAFTVIALVGVFVAAGGGRGPVYDAGVALAVASALGVFLSLKHVFDTIERQR